MLYQHGPMAKLELQNLWDYYPRHYIKFSVIKSVLTIHFPPQEQDKAQGLLWFSLFDVLLQLWSKQRLFFIVKHAIPGAFSCLFQAWMSTKVLVCHVDFYAPFLFLWLQMTDGTAEPQCLSHSLCPFLPLFKNVFIFLPSPVHPVEMANQVPALYRQSNQRPTSLKPTSTSCRLSWHVNPNVPASSSPRSTVYRSVAGQVTPQAPECLHECYFMAANCVLGSAFTVSLDVFEEK